MLRCDVETAVTLSPSHTQDPLEPQHICVELMENSLTEEKKWQQVTPNSIGLLNELAFVDPNE